MRKMDYDGLLLCKLQGDVFELSINRFSCSSDIFVRRFTNSEMVRQFDNKGILEDNYSDVAVLNDIEKEYKTLTYGHHKYSQNEMYWMGYTYRYFCYTYELSMKQVYHIVSPKEMRDLYLAYHTLDCAKAIERILEAKNISFAKEDIIKKSFDVLRKIREEK